MFNIIGLLTFLIFAGLFSFLLLIGAIALAILRMLVRAFFRNLEEPDAVPQPRPGALAAGHPSTI